MGKWLILLCLIAPLSAGEVNVWGHGNTSCGKAIGLLETRENGEKMLPYSILQWILGYLSGVAEAEPDARAATDDLDSDGVGYWVIGHCRENPLKSIRLATVALLNERLTAKK